MSDTESNRVVVPAAGLHQYVFPMYRLESELDRDEPDVEAILESLQQLTDLQGIERVGVVGDEAEHCIEYFIDDDGPVSMSEEERRKLRGRVGDWTDKYEHYLESAVAYSPTTEVPPNQLLEGSHELLAAHVGERYEPEVRDLSEAVSALCAGSYTSTEFMCIRAVERLLRKRFRERVGDRTPDRDWSEALETVVRGFEGEELPEDLRILEYLRKRREHIVEPDSHSTQEDAERTLVRTFRIVETLVDRD